MPKEIIRLTDSEKLNFANYCQRQSQCLKQRLRVKVNGENDDDVLDEALLSFAYMLIAQELRTKIIRG